MRRTTQPLPRASHSNTGGADAWRGRYSAAASNAEQQGLATDSFESRGSSGVEEGMEEVYEKVGKCVFVSVCGLEGAIDKLGCQPMLEWDRWGSRAEESVVEQCTVKHAQSRTQCSVPCGLIVSSSCIAACHGKHIVITCTAVPTTCSTAPPATSGARHAATTAPRVATAWRALTTTVGVTQLCPRSELLDQVTHLS